MIRKTSRRHRDESGNSPAIALVGVSVGLAAYPIVYLRAPLPSLSGVAEVTRWNYLLSAALLPDEVVANWFGEPAGFSWLDRLPVLFIAMAILAVAAAAGRLVMALLRIDEVLDRAEQWLFAVAVGLNLVSLYMLLIGLSGGLRRPVWLYLPAVGLIAGSAWQIKFRKTNPATSVLDRSIANDWLDRRWIVPVFLFGLFILLGALLPPVEFDVREYHLQAPKEFYQQGRITFLPHNVYANMPLGAEMFALAGMSTTGDWWLEALVGKTLIAIFAPFTALALFLAGRRFFGGTAGIVAALVYISTPWVCRVSNLGLIEGAVAFYAFMAIYALWIWTRIADPASAHRLILLAGFLAGAAAACKYPAVLFVVLPLVGFAAFDHRRFDARSLALFLASVAVACGPWFGKNLALTGNPVYPLMSSALGGETRTPEKTDGWRRAHRPPNYSVTDAVGRAADVAWRSEWLGPLMVPLAALALIFRGPHRRPAAWLWAYFGLVIVAWWLLTHRIDRFWIPALPALALAAGAGVMWTDKIAWRRLCQAYLAVGLVVSLLFVVTPAGGYVSYFVSYEQLKSAPNRVDPWHLYLNAHVAPEDAVLTVGDAQVFDLTMPVYYNTVFDDCLFETWLAGHTAHEFAEELHKRRISYVYVHWGEIARYRSPGNYGFTDFVQPSLFRELVEAGVLAPPEPAIDRHPGRVYRVRMFE